MSTEGRFVTGHDFTCADRATRIPAGFRPCSSLASTVLLLATSLLVLLAAAPAQTIRIAAAADLEPVLPPILRQFEQTTRIHADVTYQASAALTTQIQNGAPFDVFLSANLDYPRKLISAGLAQGLGQGHPTAYASGTLVLWLRNGSPLGPPSLATLSNPALKRLAIANPDRAPYGKAAVAALQKLGLYQALKPRLAIAENISQAAQFVDSGNADAGLISLTSAKTPHLSSAGSYVEIPSDDYPPIEQGAVLIAKSARPVAARKFLAFLMSAPIQQQLEKYGLKPGRRVD